MKRTRKNKAGREVITHEYAHHLATAPFTRRFPQDPSYPWAGAGIAQPLIGHRVSRGRVEEDDTDVYDGYDGNELAIVN